jgi:hypothetical protein
LRGEAAGIALGLIGGAVILRGVLVITLWAAGEFLRVVGVLNGFEGFILADLALGGGVIDAHGAITGAAPWANAMAGRVRIRNPIPKMIFFKDMRVGQQE